jgi:fructokinase
MKTKVIGIGEVLWDMLPGGRRMGGAPANFACHAHALGADAGIISRVGNDALGQEILARLDELGVATNCVEVDPDAPTGTVGVDLDPTGQPTYTIHEDVAWDRLEGGTGLRFVTDVDAICFGTLAQRTERARRSIHSVLAAAPREALRILDVNLRQNYFSPTILKQSLALANVLKLNEDELRYFTEQFHLSGGVNSQLDQLATQYDLHTIALTRGERGSVLYSKGSIVEHQGIKGDVVDTIGAGDSFTAALAMGLLARWPLEQISNVASEVAAFVCSSPGATPVLPLRLRSLFNQNQR